MDKNDKGYNIFAVMGKSHRDLKNALLKELRANGSRNLETLEKMIAEVLGRLDRIERRVEKIEKRVPKTRRR